MLTGMDNYHTWWTDTKYALAVKDLWCHISTATNLFDLLNLASFKPVPADLTSPTEAETTVICKWLVDDVKTMGFIHHFLSTPIHQLIPDNQVMTAQAIWELIGRHYGWKGLSMQFIIHKQLAALCMKDASDTSCYVGEHLSLCCCLLEMGANFSEEDSVFQLPTRLPLSSKWRLFKSQIEQHLHDTYSGTVIMSTLGAGTSISATFQHNAMTFNSCSTHICGEAYCQLNEKALSGPGLDKTNPITGLCKHQRILREFSAQHPSTP
ncbi:hypothetical protein PAXRUDRAFT_802083 [Paxillus rubicundulus Ve08.2h10]|uniref:Uncharacterized protein n=1 Tax=Paxillus rubicundulus Ve08.2h10 TaxID=930991 RepID=A0A0D0DVN0_9AGAM|nr:hypothetical protein PAXRUDRAFT_802083 [Paxillus rubicundulus Ve08.2h10]